MKKKIVALVLTGLCISFGSKSQITIKSGDMPGAGDTIRYSTAGTNNLGDYKKTGTNYTWNFSSLKPTGQEVEEYKPSIKTPYAFFFLGANKFGIKTADSVNLVVVTFYDLYDFYQNNSSAFMIEGRGMKYNGFPIASYYSDKDEIYRFPLDYGDRDSSTFRYKVDLATLASYSTSGYRINEVDGWGSITTPYGTFNCIRVKTTIVANDTIKLSIIPIGMKNTTVQYKWLAKGEKFPILEIEGSQSIFGFNVTSVKYRDIWRKFYDPNAPVADFVVSNTNPSSIDTVSFTNNTQKAGLLPSYLWSFSPSQPTFVNGTDKNSKEPQVVFTQAGTYDVKLHVENFFGKHDTLKKSYITVVDAKTLAPVADFSASKTSPAINETVVFTNLSTNGSNSAFQWTFFPEDILFENGTDEFSENPEVKFTKGGYYNVSLKATNPYGSHDTTKMNYIYASGTNDIPDLSHPFIFLANPAGHVIRVRAIMPIVEIRLISLSGKTEINLNNINERYAEIKTQNLPAGLYFIECRFSDNSMFRKKIILTQ